MNRLYLFLFALFASTIGLAAETVTDTSSPTPIAKTDLAALVALQQELEGSFGWNNVWHLTGSEESVCDLHGVTITDGKVTAIDLSSQELSGLFPYSVLALPNVTDINLSHNHLSGDVGTAMMAFAKQNPTLTAKITSLNLSHNDYIGNVWMLANSMPGLTALDVSYNRFDNLLPALSDKIKVLDISHQTIDKTIDLDLGNFNLAKIMTQIPYIALYDHSTRKHRTELNFKCTDSKEGSFVDDGSTWIVQLHYKNGAVSMPYVSRQNAFRGTSGDRLNVLNLYPDDSEEGSTFYIKIYFEQGDANFNGTIDVTDLQSMILFALDGYTKPYNFTASNLYADETINVQDVVCMVNLLVSKGLPAEAPSRMAASGDANALAFCTDGSLYVSSSLPVAAFDITLLGDVTDRLPMLDNLGFDYRIVRQSGRSRIIAYSLSGATLPAGVTAIAKADGRGVVAATLSDEHAELITAPADTSALDGINADSPVEVSYSDGLLKIAASTPLSWTLYGLDGTVYAQGTEASADLSALPAGCYIVTVASESVSLQSTKIIIKK